MEASKKEDKKMIPESVVIPTKLMCVPTTASQDEVGVKTSDHTSTRERSAVLHGYARGAYKKYHETRQVSDDEVLSTVQTLHRADASRKRILEYITENRDVESVMQDVHNLVARLQRETYAFPTIEERVRAILEDFASEKVI
ncbi:unnamed protein product [Phytophthora fragariaefolia]|uniref:Unnamed protein product n=1 Tax=Phytophthora fragariaefolia TaxID=1490495 RepID=A0A9W6XM78_9STRA|nr:unnamed protein product [Phytophthora fragariaefolia]